MSKFNLKDYKKTDGDEHIDRRLQESHKDAPIQINEVQLEDYRASSEPEVLIEKLLEEKRLGWDDEITEKRLDDHKAKFANKYRNPSAYEGDINKLEEKRLKNDPVEKEKYEAASECGKQMRWWEGVKSPDGLKVAEDKKTVKIAALDDVEEIEGMDMGEGEENTDFNIDDIAEEIAGKAGIEPEQNVGSVISETDSEKMEVVKWKELPNPQKPDLSGLYVVLAYDPTSFAGDEERIKQAALQKVLSINDSLSGKIFADDFGDITEDAIEGTVKLRVYGEEFLTIGKPGDVAAPEKPADTFLGEGNYSEVGYQEKDVDGTPMAIGKVIITEDVTPENRGRIIQEALEFIIKRHPHLEISEESLDLIDLESQGQIGYAVGVMPPELTASEDFPIVEASSKEASSKKK